MKFISILMVLAFASTGAHASIIPATITGTGAYNNDVSVIVDGVIPAEVTHWQDAGNVWWNGTGATFTLDFGSVMSVADVIVSVDNNDSYDIDYSVDGITWTNLLSIAVSDGNVGFGMDTMTTINGDIDNHINFAGPVSAQFLRFYATGGDNNYSIGEFQAIATVPVPAAVWMLLSALGFSGLLSRKS